MVVKFSVTCKKFQLTYIYFFGQIVEVEEKGNISIHVNNFISVFQEMIDEADRDGDGEINQDEFLRIMKKTSLY